MLNYEAIKAAPVATEPFSYFMTENVLSADSLAFINRDFPDIHSPGVFPLEELRYGAGFQQIIDDIKGPDLQAVIEEKFEVDLSDKPLMVTVRGQCQKKDGRIHTDSTDKIVTCLLYLNPAWQSGGGRLRLLRDGSNIENYITEIPPDGGTLVAFRRSDNSWHGHLPFEGQRRYVMFNWVRSSAALTKNVTRHRVSAKLKQFGFFR